MRLGAAMVWPQPPSRLTCLTLTPPPASAFTFFIAGDSDDACARMQAVDEDFVPARALYPRYRDTPRLSPDIADTQPRAEGGLCPGACSLRPPQPLSPSPALQPPSHPRALVFRAGARRLAHHALARHVRRRPLPGA